MQALATNSDIAPDGVILAQSVLDLHGQLLLPAGANITNDTLRSLRQRGVETVMVAAPEVTLSPGKIPPQVLQAQIDKRLRHLFRPALKAGQLNPLFHLIAEYRLKEKP
ncbi:hypothetical protein [Acidovorax radicis]|jgi:hypothetical protein|uniref:hypothetical protein n=1 Tax=Acidovorax radicis TaxID=758826 RepID=UPI001CF8C800|nr:hypothetical protein [Acidovorax radicis]UCU98121.1 hypothetical protein KI609_16520 [Acidovorax radicis]